jgi:hypothetical protein
LILNGGQRRDRTADAGLFRAGLAHQGRPSEVTTHRKIEQGSFGYENTLAPKGYLNACGTPFILVLRAALMLEDAISSG